MSKELVPVTEAPTPTELEQIMETVRHIVNTDFVPKALRGNPHAALACILYGREIGLGPMESLTEVYMIEGRPSLSAKAKLKRARQAGHSIRGAVADGVARVEGARIDNGDTMTVEFSLEDAERAGLLSDPKRVAWKKYPEDMLWARAVDRLCRRLFGDLPGMTMLGPDEAELSPEERAAEATANLPLPDDSPGGPGPHPGDEAQPPAASPGQAEAPDPGDESGEVLEGEVVEAAEQTPMFPIPPKRGERG